METSKDKWDVDPLSYEGVILRPYYVPLHKNWKKHKHFNTKAVEDSVVEFAERYAREKGIRQSRRRATRDI